MKKTIGFGKKGFLLSLFLLYMIWNLAGSVYAKAEQVPGKVSLKSISSSAYNKVTVKWKKTSGATNYLLYYKAEGSSKWIRIAKLGSEKAAYTHTASDKYPIVVGEKYIYTVRAYNKNSGKKGSYDTKGLSICTVPDLVKLKSAIWNTGQKYVTVSWNAASGCNYYRVYRKSTSAPQWKRLATVKTGTLMYVDKTANKNEKNIYTVRGYYSKTIVLGKYNKSGIAATLSEEDALKASQAKLLKKTKTAKKTSQIILVIDHNLSFWEKNSSGNWDRKLSVYCGYGGNGMSANRHEGDRTTPIGSFPILHGFGTAANPGSKMTYRKITEYSYWSGEKNTYNQWVESKTYVSGEHLIDYYQYKYAMAIGFNINPVVYGKGSAIFLHCKSYNTWNTGGCVSVEESVMKQLLQMSKNGTYIMIVKQQKDISKY